MQFIFKQYLLRYYYIKRQLHEVFLKFRSLLFIPVVINGHLKKSDFLKKGLTEILNSDFK